MRLWISGIAAVVLLIAGPARAQEPRPFGLEAGVVMGIIAVPYPTVGVVAGPWSVRVSGGRAPDSSIATDSSSMPGACSGNRATPSTRSAWSGPTFATAAGRTTPPHPAAIARAADDTSAFAYDFQVKGFFIEAGPAFGASNPVSSTFTGGLLNHVYGQMGYVHRFGKKYRDDDEDR